MKNDMEKLSFLSVLMILFQGNLCFLYKIYEFYIILPKEQKSTKEKRILDFFMVDLVNISIEHGVVSVIYTDI